MKGDSDEGEKQLKKRANPDRGNMGGGEATLFESSVLRLQSLFLVTRQ